MEQKPWQESPEEDTTAFATSATLSALEEEDGPEEVLSNREKTAMMAGRSAVFGLVFWPLELYALYLLLGVWSSAEKLEGRARTQAKLASWLAIPAVFFILVVPAVFFMGRFLMTFAR